MEILQHSKQLNTGSSMPALGIGTWAMKNVVENVGHALEIGYCHVDTAKVYNTEEGVGEAVRKCDMPREEIFVTTKLANFDQGYESTLAAIDESLEKLGMDYVDLYLVHWPFTEEMEGENRREETWKAMEEIYESGKAKAIGVSNFLVEHLEEMKGYSKIGPAVNQIELHPFWYRKDLTEYCHSHDIVVTAYSPLFRAKEIDNEILNEIAEIHEKTPAQVLLRWNIQHGNVVIPKSSNRKHIEGNMNIFDFELTEDEMTLINGLDEEESVMAG